MERRQAWGIIRSVLHEKFSFGAIKGIAGRAGLDPTRMAHLEQTSGAASASKSQLLSAIDAQVGEMDEQRLGRFLRIVTEEMLRRKPSVEPDLRESLERLGWNLHEGHLMEVTVPDVSGLPELPHESHVGHSQMNQITEVTRRNIFDAIILENVNWAGRLDEVQFLGRLFNLKPLPSTDHRFRDAGQDIWQHRINNCDWENDWVFSDPRFNLLHCQDEVFLSFLCETIHPFVRNDIEEVKKLFRLYNQLLQVDGFELVENTRISGRPVFKGKELSRAQKLLQLTKSRDRRRLKVFLCHASEDKQKTHNLYYRLAEDNYDPWLDVEKLLPGQDWQLEVKKAVRNSDVFLVLLSSKSVSKTGYVQKEIAQALDFAQEQPEGTIFLIPVRLDDGPIPERLKHLHWVNFFEDDGYKRLLRALEKREEELNLTRA